ETLPLLPNAGSLPSCARLLLVHQGLSLCQTPTKPQGGYYKGVAKERCSRACCCVSAESRNTDRLLQLLAAAPNRYVTHVGGSQTSRG
ncbi:unnamed protein product, partial [Scytosiphon promiscuus]